MRILKRCALALLGTSLLASATTVLPAAAQVVPPSPSATRAPSSTARLNVVLILADDLGAETINAYGGEYYTPRIDALARQGVLFENAHATPLCSPSRTRLMTGRENAKNYQAFGYLDPKERTFGNMFADAGYATGIVGKWQLGGNGFDGRLGITPQGAGFQESYLWQERAGIQKGSRYWGPTLWRNGNGAVSETGFGPDLMSDWALDFVDRHKAEPFFLYYPMVLPHSPFVATPDSPSGADDKMRFAGMVTYMDTLVGKLLDKLTALGLDKNTLVIFTGDNGTDRNITSWLNGAAVTGGKFTSTIAGTHVPMVLRWPGRLPEAQRREGLFDFEDVLPTIADAAGLTAPANIDGVSQIPVAEGKMPAARSWIFQHFAPVWAAMPARYAFDATRKLYGDGKYVALDLAHGTETPVGNAKNAREARHRAKLQQVLDTRNDGPLDQVRFPWCLGKTSVDPARPPIEAGCGLKPSGE